MDANWKPSDIKQWRKGRVKVKISFVTWRLLSTRPPPPSHSYNLQVHLLTVKNAGSGVTIWHRDIRDIQDQGWMMYFLLRRLLIQSSHRCLRHLKCWSRVDVETEDENLFLIWYRFSFLQCLWLFKTQGRSFNSFVVRWSAHRVPNVSKP